MSIVTSNNKESESGAPHMKGTSLQDPKASKSNASLYVGDLLPDTTEAILYDIFLPVGQIASIRVCRDAMTRKSLGYAYVNYHNPDDASSAIDSLNFTKVKDHPLRIMWVHRDPSLRKSGTGNLFVKNLSRDIDKKQLHDMFSPYGKILSCKVATDYSGKPLGYGFVHFELEDNATIAVDKMHGSAVNEKPIYVAPFQKRSERPMKKETPFTNLYIRGFPEEYDEDQVKELFSPFGEITSAAVKMDSKKNKKFAFVNFENPDSAQSALNELNGKALDNDEENTLYVSPFQTKAERVNLLRNKYKEEMRELRGRYQGTNLYVKNLDNSIDDERLHEAFKEFGTITSAKVMKDNKLNQSRGFGFVCFLNPEDATNAVTVMHQKTLNGKPLYVGLAERKDQRLMRLQQRFHPNRYYVMAGGMGVPPPPPQYMTGYMEGGNWNTRNQNMAGRWTRMQHSQGYPRGSGYTKNVGPDDRNRQYMISDTNKGMYGGVGRHGGNTNVPQAGYGIRFTPQARNRIEASAVNTPSISARASELSTGPAAAGTPGDAPLTVAALAAAQPQMQKQILGEKLFPLVSRYQPEHAGKVTGMMLEMDNTELLVLLESEQHLQAKVEEAMKVLKHAQRAF